MNSDRATRYLPVLVSIVIAFMLMMMPLPDSVSAFRPDWVALIMIFWTMSVPRRVSVGVAWIVGIFVDVSQGTLLGQHALALCAVAYVTVKFHLLMRVFPLMQLTATIFALLALYQFLLFWINGVVGINAPSMSYWAPVISGTLIWPLVYTFVSGMRYRVQMSI